MARRPVIFGHRPVSACHGWSDPLASPVLPANPHRNPAVRWRWLLPAAALVAAFHFAPFGGMALDRAFFDAASRHPFRPAALPANSALVLVDEATMAKLSTDLGLRWPYPAPPSPASSPLSTGPGPNGSPSI